MSQKVEMVFTAQEAQAVQSIMSIIRAQGRMEQKFTDMGRSGGRAGNTISKGWGNVNVDIGKAAMAMGGLATATQAFFSLTQLVSAELQNIEKRGEDALKSNVELGKTVFELTQGLQRIGISPQQFQAMLVAPESRLALTERGEIMNAAASAVESKEDTLRALDMYRTAVEKFSALDQKELRQLTAAASRLSAQERRAPQPGEPMGAGEMAYMAMAAQAAPGLKEQNPEVYKNLTAGAVAFKQLGVDARESIKLLISLAQASGDITMEQSRVQLVKLITAANMAASATGSTARGMDAFRWAQQDTQLGFRLRTQLLESVFNEELQRAAQSLKIPAEVLKERMVKGKKIEGVKELPGEAKIMMAAASFLQSEKIKQPDLSALETYKRLDETLPKSFEEAATRWMETNRQFEQTQGGGMFRLESSKMAGKILEDVLKEQQATTSDLQERLKSRMESYGWMAGYLMPATEAKFQSAQFGWSARLFNKSVQTQIQEASDALFKLAIEVGSPAWQKGFAGITGRVGLLATPRSQRVAAIERMAEYEGIEGDRRAAMRALAGEIKGLQDVLAGVQEMVPVDLSKQKPLSEQLLEGQQEPKIDVDRVNRLRPKSPIFLEWGPWRGLNKRMDEILNEAAEKAKAAESRSAPATNDQQGQLVDQLKKIEANTRGLKAVPQLSAPAAPSPVPSRVDYPVPSDPRSP
jgi:hypothetical protein